MTYTISPNTINVNKDMRSIVCSKFNTYPLGIENNLFIHAITYNTLQYDVIFKNKIQERKKVIGTMMSKIIVKCNLEMQWKVRLE